MPKSIEDVVRAKYGSTATSGLSSDQEGVRAVAEAFGYSADDLASIPASANMALSCGNPIATANLRPGETVVDLGSGGGLDVFLAARKVGPSGKSIGIDMTSEMIALARENLKHARSDDGQPLTNVVFHQAAIDQLPLDGESADCVISNCVINLAEDKPAVFREIARVLKPGGRVAISDIALKRELPAALAENLMAYVGCIAGAISIDDYRKGLIDAGFSHVEIIDSQADLNVYAKAENASGCCSAPSPSAASATRGSSSLEVMNGGCCSPSSNANEERKAESASGCCSPSTNVKEEEDNTGLHAELATLMRQHNVNDYAASVKVFAVKPQRDEPS